MKSSNKKLIKIAKIIDAKGLRGEVKVLFLSGDSILADKLCSITSADGTIWEIEKVGATSKSDRVDIKFEGVNDRTQAEKLKGLELYVEEETLQSAQGEEIYLREILGFEVLDKDEVVGVITGFESNGPQDLLIVEESKTKKILIPLVKEFTVKIDFENKKVKMNLPPGLRDQ